MNRAAQVAALRPRYQDDLARGVARFFRPRRTDCPWCGSEQLEVRLRTPDLLQHKPGRFVLERCRECRHTFQNPQLNEDGLEFYYRDFYDGLGEENLATLFRAHDRAYRLRAGAVTPTPSRRPGSTWAPDTGTSATRHGPSCPVRSSTGWTSARASNRPRSGAGYGAATAAASWRWPGNSPGTTTW